MHRKDAFDPDPPTLAEVEEWAVYRLATAARLLGVHPETVVRHGAELLPKPFRTSPLRLLGREILRLAGVREIDRAARTCEPSETERERKRRADAAMERVRELTKGKAN